MESTKFVQRVWSSFRANKGHDATSFGNLKILSAVPGCVRAQMVVEDFQVNRLKTLHGGCTSGLVDTMGSLALSSRGLWMTGVSTDISVTFVRAAALGETISLKAEVIGQGRSLAYTRVEIESLKTGKLLAYGSHTKYIVEALKGAENMKFSEDGERVLEKGQSS